MHEEHTGRSAGLNTPNRFAQFHLEPLEIDSGNSDEERSIPTVFYKDLSRSILSKNQSPDLSFSYSLNPYRGCEHGCIYCYARPSHEYLGFSAGLDFESKITVKMDAPTLLQEELGKRSWVPQVVALAGNTDCYQPVERELALTRECLKVFLSFRNPVGIITKNILVLRDLDILGAMAKMNLVEVLISITTLDRDLARTMEPRASTPQSRLLTIERLAQSGIPVAVNVAPIIPGLTDEEIPRILQAAADAGASSAGYQLLRLAGPVQQLFLDWLDRNMPDRAPKIVNRIRDTRGGELNDSRFGLRMRGEGEIARAIDSLFEVHSRKYGLDGSWRELNTTAFRRNPTLQTDLFE
jgi:DNA repair photolyase